MTTKIRCEFCLGPLGLIYHRKGSLRFCKKAHKKAWEHRTETERLDKIRWLNFIVRGITTRTG
jgi:hypothetical protein